MICIVPSKKIRDPNCTMSSVPSSPSRRCPGLPPMPPLDANTYAAGTVALATSNSASSRNADVDNFVDAFLSSLPENSAGDDANYLREGGTADEINTTPPPSRLLFTLGSSGGLNGNEESTVPADALRGSIFPSAIPTVQNRFFNQNSELNDAGYDSEGGLPFFAGKQVDSAVDYSEAPLNDAGRPPPATAPPAAAVVAAAGELTVKSVSLLNVAKLKDELKRRGWSIAGEKGELQDRLREAILLNVPVASGGGDAVRCHESMSGLDVTARWELLTSEYAPIPEPENQDCSLRPPTEMDGTTNPKYSMKETFVRGSFTGTNEKMRYAFVEESPMAPPKKRARKSRKCTPMRKQVVTEIEPRVLGGSNVEFLRRYGLDETSHPMDWFSAFMPMTPDMNREDPAAANVKGNRTTKFAVSNWTGYSNPKAMLCNAGEPGHIFAWKFKTGQAGGPVGPLPPIFFSSENSSLADLRKFWWCYGQTALPKSCLTNF